MREQSPRTPLGRLLEEEAAATFADDFDLWPGLAARIAERPTPPQQAASPHWSGRFALGKGLFPWAVSSAAGRTRHASALVGAAALIALIAIAFGTFALVRFPPTGEPTPVNVAASPMASPIADRKCTIEQEIAAEATSSLPAGAEPIQFSIDVQASRACERASGFQLQLSDTSGNPLPIEGNPLTVPFMERGDLRFINAEVTWANWCGPQDQKYRVDDGYVVSSMVESGNSQLLEMTPACQDKSAPSTLEVKTSRSYEDPDVMKRLNCRAIAAERNEEWTGDLTTCERWAIAEGRG